MQEYNLITSSSNENICTPIWHLLTRTDKIVLWNITRQLKVMQMIEKVGFITLWPVLSSFQPEMLSITSLN